MGGVIWLFFVMLLVAAAAFAPLGYFIYKYTIQHKEPFADSDHPDDSESKLLGVVEQAINAVKNVISKK